MQEVLIQKPKNRRRWKFIAAVVILLLIIAPVAVFIKNMNGPAQGAVAYTSPSQPANEPASSQPKNYDGKFISITYPDHYKIVPSQQSNGYKETISLTDTDHSGKYITIGVLKESLNNDSGISYRRSHPELYKIIASGADKAIFSGTSSAAEMTGFIAHEGYVATISITANGQRDLTEDFNTLSNSLTWKQ
jgi:hypothetical protein